LPTPYLIGLTVQYPSGTALSNVNITCRVESTNQFNTQTTNSSGQVIFNLGSKNQFSKGFTVGDKVSVFSLYTGFQQTFSFTIPNTGETTTVKDNSGVTVGTASSGGLTATLVLVAVPSLPTLRYFAVQDFLDTFNVNLWNDDNENGVKVNQIVNVGEGVEAEIDNLLGQKFDNNSGSYYSQTEYVDTNEDVDFFFLTKTPVSSITNLYTTENDEDTAPAYSSTYYDSLTENTHYMLEDTDTGRIVIVDSSYQPGTRRRGAYIIYKYGYSSVPLDIKRLAILMTGRTLMSSTFTRSIIEGRSYTAEMLAINEEINRILESRRRIQIRNT